MTNPTRHTHSPSMPQSKTTPIDKNWHFTQVGGGHGTRDGEWIPAETFPTTVHVELIKKGIIPDPFVGLNEHKVQWIGEADWAFRTFLTVSETDLASTNADIVFEGLDTYASVTLNGFKILESSNQFVPYRTPAKDLLKVGQNELFITFHSTWLKGKGLERENGKFTLWNGDSSRLHVRKAQYNYGWDWGPILMTVGPWRPIYLETYESRISDLRVKSNLNDSLTNASLNIEFSTTAQTGTVSVVLKTPDETILKQKRLELKEPSGIVSLELGESEFDLWWPVGYGKQPLYDIVVTLENQGKTMHTQHKKIGFRRVWVVQDSLVDQDGKTFLFEINNVRIFCGGSNWIPADSFLTTVSDAKYRSWLHLLVEGNQNMIRVWGGGIYEADVFYDICDELGILVWQDFMFGCGQYPAYDDFLERLTPEVRENVKRLRHHPSIVIFAGNNEDYQLAESNHLELDYNDEDPNSDFRKTNFPARHIYERVLPSIVSELSDVHYHRSSPYSGFGKVTTDKQHGDLHQWNVWHGSQEPWHNWDILAGRFVSEFGMEAFPDIRTVDFWLGGDQSERYPQSATMASHNKADGYERRIETYLVENFRHTFDMDSYVYHTQIMQAETLASAYRLWRRNWKGPGREYTAGALVWQINDCWPVTSWAIVDYFLRPKPSYFAIARELKKYTVGIKRRDQKTFKDKLTAANYVIKTIIEIWGSNFSLTEKKVRLEVTSFDLQSTWVETTSKEVTLLPNRSMELFEGILPGQPERTNASERKKDLVVQARLLDSEGAVLARCSNWPEPFKHIKFPTVNEANLQISILEGGESVELRCSKPIKGIILNVEGDDVKWSDQAIDLVPGDPQIINVVGLNGRKISARFLGDGSA